MELMYFTPPPQRGNPFAKYGRLFKGSGAPPPPDPVATANAQKDANIDAAKATIDMNRYNEQTPFANSTWSTDPTTGKQTNTTTLDPHVQDLLNSYYQKSATPVAPVTSNMQTMAPAPGPTTSAAPVDVSLSYKDAPAMPVADEAGRKAIEDAYYSNQTARLDPQWKTQELEMRSRLANQGITEGSEAYNRELQQMMMGRNDAYSQARNDATLNSTGEMQKLFGMGLASRQEGVSEANNIANFGLSKAQLDMAKEQQAYTQAMGSHQQTSADKTNQFNQNVTVHNSATADTDHILNSLMAMASGSQVQSPGATPVNVAAAPIAQSIYNSYNGQMQAAQMSNSTWNSLIGAAGTLGGAALLM